MFRQRIETAYDNIAAKYAASDAQMPPTLIEFGGRFLSTLKPGARILDAGCGAGRDMAWMETQGFQVTGIDLSTGMLAQARERVKGELHQMDLGHLAFPANSFEGIWCNAVLLHVPKAEVAAILGQMHNILVPGGLLYLGLQEGQGEGWEVTRFCVERFFARYSAEEIEQLLSQNGFSMQELHQDQPWLNLLASAQEAEGRSCHN